MTERTAIVIGATGLVGSQLLEQLLHDERFTAVKVLGRRVTGVQHPKLKEYVVHFDRPSAWQQLVTGDVLFSAMGTTLRQAGTKEAQYKIDHTYQYETAKAAAKNGVPVYVLVSSAMADEKARLFYTRMKGELERDVKRLPFEHIQILQPGMLAGNRKENRTGEKLGLAVVRFLNKLGIAKKQKPVDAAIVARAMINLSFRPEKVNTVSLLDVFSAAASPVS